MMTMDVSMYSNQQQTYPESYCQPPEYPPDHHYYNDNGELHYYQDIPQNHDHPGPPMPLDHPDHIINTDNGLSYTNLDYSAMGANQPYSNHTSIPSSYHPHDVHYNIPHIDLNHQHNHHPPPIHKIDNHFLESKYNMHFIDSDNQTAHSLNPYPHIVMHQSGSPSSCLEYQGHYQGKNEHIQDMTGGKDILGGDCYRQQELGSRQDMGRQMSVQGSQGMGLSQGGSQHHHAVPTYKWMQVKRNVPKPAGESLSL